MDVRDSVYLMLGLAFLGLTALPLASGRKLVSLPTLYVAAGALLTFTPMALPLPDPLAGPLSLAVIEHGTELVVIMALASAGLAVDRTAGPREWQHCWALLAITMPLTIVGMYVLGTWAGLGTAAAMLLAAAMAPTDPVLARSVQVEGPNEGDEDDVRVSLTTEAGLNDGLAFPFVWLAIAFAQTGATNLADGLQVIWADWLLLDVGWRIAAGLLVGWAIGHGVARFVLSSWGDAYGGGHNAGLVFLGATFVAYGTAEAVGGYGFLAVFIAARATRGHGRSQGADDYASLPHGFGDQAEKVLLAILLVWLGGFAASGLLIDLTWQEVMVALGLIFVLRPLAGLAGMAFTRGDRFQRIAIASLGIRGMGSLFYLAFAFAASDPGGFGPEQTLWRIAVMTVVLSIIVHGAIAPIAMQRLDNRRRARRTFRSAVTGD